MLLRFMRGRIKCKLCSFVFSLLILLLCAYFYQQLGFSPIAPVTFAPISSNGRIARHLSKLITVVFRQFEEENDIAASVQSFITAFPNMPVLVLCDSMPYPPFSFSYTNRTLRNVRVISLELKLDAAPSDLNPLSYIKTEYVLLVPDSIRVSRRVLQHATTAAMSSMNLVAIGTTGAKLICQSVQWQYADWTLLYKKDNSATLCDAVSGRHSILMRTSLLQIIPQPFAMPLPESLYLKTTMHSTKVQIFEGRFGNGAQKVSTIYARDLKRFRESRSKFFQDLSVKAVIRNDNRVQWFGCKKETPRCFPSVQGIPSFVLAGRNTPPCCRRNMRQTVNHVLNALTTAGARYWLETTSLLGAVARGDLLPYAEYAEIGVHANDVSRITWLTRGSPDSKGFVWERATRGRYYRVAYSATNRVYVLILPFVARNGTMWPDDWVLAHQSEFPERHLHPLAQIPFVGRLAPAPNDARAFLDIKLGAKAVERSTQLGVKLLYPQLE